MTRARRGLLIAVAAIGLAATTYAAPAHASALCTWGGTPAAPTGFFSIEPGLTNLPAAKALDFYATGVLGGGCQGRMTWRGQVDAGSTCPLALFEGQISGLPG